MPVTCDNVPPCPRFESKCIPLLRNRRAERESTAATCLKCHRTTQANRRVALSIRPCRSLKRPVPVQPGERHVDAAQRDRRARRLSGPSCLPRLRCRPGQALPLRWLERPWCGAAAARSLLQKPEFELPPATSPQRGLREALLWSWPTTNKSRTKAPPPLPASLSEQRSGERALRATAARLAGSAAPTFNFEAAMQGTSTTCTSSTRPGPPGPTSATTTPAARRRGPGTSWASRQTTPAPAAGSSSSAAGASPLTVRAGGAACAGDGDGGVGR